MVRISVLIHYQSLYLMLCFIYKSLKKDLYLYIAKKDDFLKGPEALLNYFEQMEFVTQ